MKDTNTLLSFLWNLVQIMWLQLIFLDKKLKIVLFYNSKLEFMFPLVTLITKRFSKVKLSLNSQGWLSFATQAASSENNSERKKAVNCVWGRRFSKTTEICGCEFKYIYIFYRSWHSDNRPKQIAFGFVLSTEVHKSHICVKLNMWKLQMLYLDCIHYVYRRRGGGGS